MEKNEHFLSVLVECQLYNIVRAIRESDLKNKEKLIDDEIKKFVENLPPHLASVPNAESLVRSVLERTEKNSKEIKEADREEER